jgi:hypothetical protein
LVLLIGLRAFIGFPSVPPGAAELEDIERGAKRWGRGSTMITVNETGRRLLRIMPS